MPTSSNSTSIKLLLLFLYLSASSVVSIPSTGTPPRISAYSGLTSISTKLYTFGGIDLEGYLINDLHSFDLPTKRWSTLQTNTQSSPSPRTSSVVTSYLGNIYIFGGKDSAGVQEELWQYKISTGSWLQILIPCLFPVARTQPGYVLTDNLLFIFGGITNAGPDSSLLM